MCKNAAAKSLLTSMLLALAAMPALAAERLTFTNSDPQVLSLLAAEGVAGATQVDAEGRALAQLEMDGGLAAIYAQEKRELYANLYLDGGKDVYRFKGLAECAGLVEVDFAGTAFEAQIRSSALESRGRYLTQAVATSGLPTGRELLAVRGGTRHRVEVAWTGGIDNGGEAMTFTRTFEVAVGCDQLVQLSVGGRAAGSVSLQGGLGEALDEASADLAQGHPASLPRREAGDRLLGQESAGAETLPLVEPGQVCQGDDFNDDNLDGWTFSLIGDADQGGAVAAGGVVDLTADGTSFYHAPDNGGFLHRSVPGDFRAQVKLLGFPSNTGGGFKKTSLTVRSGLGPDDPRVTIQFIPNHPTYNTTAIQFDYRDAAGVERELASTALNVPIPAYLMLERRGTVFSAYYSTDGSSWIRQLGGAGNAVSINMPGTLEIGMMNASYSATIALTAQFDDFKVCSPNVISLPPVPAEGLCLPGTPIDILYLLDSTGSMTFPFTGGGVSKLDAARQAIAEMNDLIEGSLPGSRAALVTFQGGFTPAYNLNSAVHVLSHLTTDFDAVDAAAASIDVAAINPDATTPIAIALNRTYDIFQAEADPDHIPVVIFIGDGWANIDMLGNGPSYYRFEEMQAISIGAYLPPGQVAWLGNFNGPLGTYDGQVLADAMVETLRLKEDIPNFMMFTLGVHSNATFRPDLLGFMALYTGAEFYNVTSAEDLVGVLVGIYNGLDCGAQIGDRVWDDANGDGVQDPGEAGLEGVTVELVDGDGNVVDTQVTDADGEYLFDHVFPDTYTVRVVTSTLPDGFSTQTFDFDGLATPDVATVTVTDDQIFLDADFGYRACAGSIGDRVWFDQNGNGVQDGGEPGIGGVTVELLDGSNAVIATATTDANGLYSFDSLVAGNYTVRIDSSTLPAGSSPSHDPDGTATPHQATVVLGCNQNTGGTGFGYRYEGSIGDRVWNDQDGDGVQDGGEPGLSGVTVELRDSSNVLVASQVTDAGGNYSFTGLGPGTYTVSVVPAGLGSTDIPTFDRDGIASPNLATVVLAASQAVTDADFGYRGCDGSAGNRVWLDADADGVQDRGEAGIAGVTVQLLDTANVAIATTVTDAGGNYAFPGLGAGAYTVKVFPRTLPNGALPTYDLDGIATAHQATFKLGCDQDRDDVDFGYSNSGSIGDRVWKDTDGDGVQDGGETGLTGVTVELRDASNVLVASTVTGPNGIYSFPGLAAGTYTVTVVPAGLGANTTPTFDLDGVATPHVASVVLTAGQTRTDVDFGYRACAGSIGDKVWDDKDGDGVKDSGEVGIGGVTLQLVDASNNVVATTTTNSSGTYTFSNVGPGTYTVRVVASSLPAGATPTFDRDGIASANQAVVTLSCNQNKTDVDFGYKFCLGSIGDKVWDDKNGNGSQNSGEGGIAGVTVELLNAGGTVIATQVTSSGGGYSFTGLVAGTYSVRVVASSLPAGYTQTYDKDGVATPHIATFTLSCNQNKTDIDFGYKGCGGSIGDKVWDDKNGNGVLNSGETGISGVTVQLYNSSNVLVATATTNSSGKYTFSNLGAGTYTVKVVASTVGDSVLPTFDLDGTGTPNQATVTLSCGQVKTDVDFGYRFCNGWLGDRVWDDEDGDGNQDGEEKGLEGVQLQLVNSSNVVVATTTTGDDGWYGFSNVVPGTYKVKVVTSTLPEGIDTATHDLDGLGSLHQATVTINCNGKNEHVDFGYRNPSSGGGWCPRTIGYWKNHTSEWPARNLELGDVTYNMTQLIAFLNYSGSDASHLLAKQLVATKLNLLMGSDTWITSIVKDADDFLEDYPPGSNPQGSKRDWALKLKDDLDKYNNDPNCH